MKKILLTTACILSFTVPAMAEEDIIPGEFSANVGFVSEYSFRGIAQSNEQPAIQGGFDWAHDSGVYAGVWASNVEFGDATIETDLYAGFSNEIYDTGISYDVGAIYYVYPGSDDRFNYNFYEVALALGYDFEFAAVSASVNYSPDYFGKSGDGVYMAAFVDIPLDFMPVETAINLSVGHQTIDDRVAFGVDDYTDWGVGISANIEGFDVGLKYIDTNLNEPRECTDGCEGRVIASISKALP